MGGHEERAHRADARDGFDARAGFEQRLGERRVAVVGSPVERRAAVAVGGIHVHALREQRANGGRITILDGVDEPRVSGRRRERRREEGCSGNGRERPHIATSPVLSPMLS